MTRAAVVGVIAVLALMLVYPATTPSARAPVAQDTPTTYTITPWDGGDTPAFTGDDNGGDADDLAGMKERKGKPAGTLDESDFMIQARLAFRVWWMYFVALELGR
jgi:hypothetical protein